MRGIDYLSVECIELEFGLGDAEMVGQLRVRRPSGTTQVIEDVSADQVVQITEFES